MSKKSQQGTAERHRPSTDPRGPQPPEPAHPSPADQRSYPVDRPVPTDRPSLANRSVPADRSVPAGQPFSSAQSGPGEPPLPVRPLPGPGATAGPQPDRAPSLGHPGAEIDLTAFQYEDDDEDDDDPTPEELFELTLDAVERAVDGLMHWPDEDAAEDVACELRDEITDLAGDWDASGPTSVYGILSSCLTIPRRAGLPTGPVIGWVTERLGAEPGADALLLGGVLGYAPATPLTFVEVQNKMSNDIVIVMLWMVAGLAATTGQGRASWLRQFIPYPEF